MGPIGGARVGFKDGAYILNPTVDELTESALDLVVAGTQEGVLMVESEAGELSEEIMLGAVSFGHLIGKAVAVDSRHLRQRNRLEAQKRAFHGRRNGAGICHRSGYQA